MIKNLLTKSDINKIHNKILLPNSVLTKDELTLYNESSKKESQIQIACNNIIKDKYGHLKDCNINFVQVDNGSKSGIAQKKKKKAEGTMKGFPDVVIWIYAKMTTKEYMEDCNLHKYLPIKKKQIFIEFKKIGSYRIRPEQQNYHDFLKKWDESVYFCNNTVFFEKVICKEIEDFLTYTP